MKASRFNFVIVKSLRGSVWKTLLAIRSVGKVVILVAFLVHATAWVMLFNVDFSFNRNLPASIFGQRVNYDVAADVAFASLLAGAVSLFVLVIFIPFVLIDFGALARWVRSLLIRKVKDGHCRVCGYNLMGNTSGVCPECGMAVRIPSRTILI